ncbi:MAG: patatin-like phospholipase family protein [Betaproteobacteria bacterium]|nr:patatin-like phospholipase family protein [Betaproteobacteria bacterium]
MAIPRPIASFAASLLVACLPALACHAAESPGPASASATRPRIALVLSGGGARGLSHIGVLKVLRELRVPVDAIAATSMGSIVGGAYAAGRTPEEMETIVKEADWATIFSDRPPRKDLNFRRKEDDLRFIGQTEFGLSRDGLVLPGGAFGSQNVEVFLRQVARPGSEAKHLDALSIPLRAVATDLVSGEQVVLRDVPLSVAMRASMSVPGVCSPTRIGERLLGDGGLTRNLPVEVGRAMGADVIIAVNVGTPLLPREALGSAFGVAQQMINILTEQNVAASLRELRPQDVLVSPDLQGFTFFDFERADDLVARGEAATRAMASRLLPLALDEKAYAAWDAVRRLQAPHADPVIEAIETRGTVRTNPQALANEVANRTHVAVGDVASPRDYEEASRALHGSGEFSRVDVRPENRDGRTVAVIDVEEKAWGPDYLRIGGRAVTDFHTDGRFSITLQHTRTWVNPWGAEWRNELQVGDLRRVATRFYQPLGPGSPWFVEPVLEALKSDHDIYVTGNRRTDRVTNEAVSGAMALGRRLGSTGVARVLAGHQRFRTSPAISSRDLAPAKDSANFLKLDATFDTLDDANFPRRGYLASVNATRTDYRAGEGSQLNTVVGQLLWPVTFDRLTLLGLAFAGRAKEDRDSFTLGGFLNLSGTPVGALAGSQAAGLSLVTYYRMGELPRVLGRGWYMGLSLEAGDAWNRATGFQWGQVKKAGSVFVGADTVAGPFYAGWGKTYQGDSAFYLFLGRPTDFN